MKTNKATIYDISEALGIDGSTVSRALNNSERVSQKTKDKIQKKAEELGYQRNNLASKLSTSISNTIGVIVPRISRHFFASVIAGIEETAYDLGYDVIIGQSLDNFQREQKLIETLGSNRVDGILISISMETINDEHFKDYTNHGHPIIFFDRPFNTNSSTNIIIDDFRASFEATEHLIQQGCKKIVHFSGPQELELYVLRKNGYKAALKKHGIPVDNDYIIQSRLMKEDGIASAKELLCLPEVDAVFSSNDTAAISALKYLKSQGILIPEDIAFVGFSNEPVSEVIEPSLTTVNQPDFEMGKVATELLIDQIKNNSNSKKNNTKILKPQLIIRDSSVK